MPSLECRGDEIKVFPLSFSEYVEAFDRDKQDAWNEYVLYGSLPLILSKKLMKNKQEHICQIFIILLLLKTLLKGLKFTCLIDDVFVSQLNLYTPEYTPELQFEIQ